MLNNLTTPPPQSQGHGMTIGKLIIHRFFLLQSQEEGVGVLPSVDSKAMIRCL